MRSVTSPDQQKRLYVDPRMMPLIEGRRVLLVDDVISSGTSIVAGLRLMKLCGINPVAIAAAMRNFLVSEELGLAFVDPAETKRTEERLRGSSSFLGGSAA